MLEWCYSWSRVFGCPPNAGSQPPPSRTFWRKHWRSHSIVNYWTFPKPVFTVRQRSSNLVSLSDFWQQIYSLVIEQGCFQSLQNNIEYHGVILINFSWSFLYDVYVMRSKHVNHDDDAAADAAGNTGIILLLTRIPGYQMLRMQHAIFTMVSRTGEVNEYLLRRQRWCAVLQDQEAYKRSVNEYFCDICRNF